MKAWRISPCPRCGRPERHRGESRLSLCAVCLILEAESETCRDRAEQTRYDLEATIEGICKRHRLRRKMLAFQLKISPSHLSDAVARRRRLSAEAFEIVKEKFPDCLIRFSQEVPG